MLMCKGWNILVMHKLCQGGESGTAGRPLKGKPKITAGDSEAFAVQNEIFYNFVVVVVETL